MSTTLHPPLEPSPATILAQLRAHREKVYQRGHACTEAGREISVFPTGITRGRGEQLRELLRHERPARTIETGFALGLSSLFIIEALLESTAPGPRQHTAIDPYQHKDWGGAGLRTIREAGVVELMRFFAADSALVLPALAAASTDTGEVFDAAFVDGSHLFDGVFIDLFYMTRLVRPGGLIVLDDYWMPAVRAAIDFFTTNCGLTLSLLLDEKGRPKTAALRTPEKPAARAWDHFVPFAATG